MKQTTTLVLFACLWVLGGCATSRDMTNARPYPGSLAQKGSVNIQVVRQTTTVELTNTTARDYGASTLWLNARYSRPIDGLKVGETLTLSMKQFRDEHGDAFRHGGFFATETPDRLVLAQIETKDAEGKAELIGLVVVGGVPE